MRAVLGPLLLLALPAFAADDEPRARSAFNGDGPPVGMQDLTIDTAPVQKTLASTCSFVTECVEDEACAATEFTAQLDGRAGGMTADDLVIEAQLVADSGTTQMLGLRSTGAMALSGGLFDARHFLTVSSSGAARYTVHYTDGPFAITYLGTCE